MQVIKTKINPEVLIQYLLLLGLSIVFGLMLFGGMLADFLHPRFLPFITGSFVFFIILSFGRLPYFYTHHCGIPVKPQYLLFLGFMLLFFFAPKDSVEAKMAELRGVSANDATFYSGEGTAGTADRAGGPGAPGNARAGKEAGSSLQDATDTSRERELQTGTETATAGTVKAALPEILANYTTFVPALDEVFGDPQKYEGKTILVRGFKFMASDLPAGHFLIARLAITCCVADAMPIGIECAYAEGNKLSEKGYYELTGVIRTEMTEVQGKQTLWPFIEVKKHKEIAPPAKKYLYLY